MEIISKQFEEFDVCGKVTQKSKLQKIAYPDLNFMCPPPEKVNTKGAQKKPMTKYQRSTKRDPSYWEYVDALHSMQNSNSSVKRSASSSDQAIPGRNMSMLDQFHPFIHDSIENIVDVKADDNCRYHAIAALLDKFEELKKSLLVDGSSMWARIVAYENGIVAVIMRSDTNTGSRGRSSFVLIGCERSGLYKCRNKEFVRRDTRSRKCGCPFRLRGKPMHGGEGWMVKLIYGIHNYELAKSLVGHPYPGRLTKDEKKIIADMTKSMVKPKNILLTLKEHNANSCTTIKQICNARSAYRSSIRGAYTKMQHLMKLLEHSTYKTNRYRLPLLDFVGVTPMAMTFSVEFAYLESERVNNIVWALERFRGLFLRNDRLPVVIVTDRDLTLMNAVKTVFPKCTNLLCRFHIDKNVKAKYKSLIGQKNVWDYVMDNWGTLVDCPSEQQFAESLQKFQIACSPWPMFVDYVNDTWIIPHKEKLITAWTNKVMHLGNTTTNRNALNEIASEVERLRYLGKDTSSFGCVMRSTLGLPCACELSRYIAGSIPVDSVHMFWRRLCFSDQGLCEAEVSIKEEIETISKRFEELDVCGKLTLKSKLRDIAYPNHNSMCLLPQSNSSVKRSASSFELPKPTRIIPMLDQFAPFIHDFIHNVVDVKTDNNCGYRSIAGLLGIEEDSWPLVSVDKWMNITEMGYVIASRYNVILVSLSQKQSMTFFPLRSQPPDSSVHRMICVGHVFGNHFVQAKQWPTPYLVECSNTQA
ncbi:Protein FAR1-RELATED SEQUENCE 5 [Glycine soja]